MEIEKVNEIYGQKHPICKIVSDNIIVYGKEWLYKHLEEEFERLKNSRELLNKIEEMEKEK